MCKRIYNNGPTVNRKGNTVNYNIPCTDLSAQKILDMPLRQIIIRHIGPNTWDMIIPPTTV